MYYYKKPTLSRVGRALLPPVCLVMLSVVIYLVIKIALLLPPTIILWLSLSFAILFVALM